MLYEYDLTVTALKPQDDPAEVELVLTKGVINRVEVQFPIGTRGLVHVQIYRGGHQLYPTNPDGNIKADGWPVVWDEHEELTDEPLTLKAIAWSTADTYSYDVTIRVNLLPLDVAGQEAGVFGSLKKLLKFMGVRG